MIERDIFNDHESKLQGVCESNSLLYRFNRNRYPITLTIEPDTSLDAQLTLAEDAASPARRGASITFIFKDGCLRYKTTGGFELADTTFGKIKNIFRKMHYAYLQLFYLTELQAAGGEIDLPDESDTDDPPENTADFEPVDAPDGELDDPEAESPENGRVVELATDADDLEE